MGKYHSFLTHFFTASGEKGHVQREKGAPGGTWNTRNQAGGQQLSGKGIPVPQSALVSSDNGVVCCGFCCLLLWVYQWTRVAEISEISAAPVHTLQLQDRDFWEVSGFRGYFHLFPPVFIFLFPQLLDFFCFFCYRTNI